MIKAVIFDCFGVLVGHGFDETYRQAGGDPLKDKDFIEDILGQANLSLVTHEEFHRQVAERLGISVEKWHDIMLQAEQPNQELLTYIESLRGRYKTGLLSNANAGTIEHRLSQAVLDDCFDKVVVSGEVGLVKPSPEVYALMAERLDVEPADCVFIDDSKMHIEGAVSVGMKGILYRNFGQMKADLESLLADTED